MKPKNREEIQENLASVGTFLSMQSSLLPGEDALSWAASCIQTYVEGREESLDLTFGLRDPEKVKPGLAGVPSGEHDDWIGTALRLVISKTPADKEWPVTKDLADIGRFCGLGGGDGEKNNDTDDESIAAELKRILALYDSIAIEKLGKKIEITEILNTAKD